MKLPGLKLSLKLSLTSGLLVLALASLAAAQSKETALDRYVHAPDSSYKYELVNTIQGEGYKAYIIDLTSQTWKPPVEPDRTVWKHWLTIVKPDDVKYTTGFLYITGGSNKDKAPDKIDPMIMDLALTTHSVSAQLNMVPNQPLTFPDGTKANMTEDTFIAYTWDKFLRTGNELWPARLPMTKSAVKALDTITDFMKSDAGGKVKVDTFMVAGRIEAWLDDLDDGGGRQACGGDRAHGDRSAEQRKVVRASLTWPTGFTRRR